MFSLGLCLWVYVLSGKSAFKIIKSLREMILLLCREIERAPAPERSNHILWRKSGRKPEDTGPRCRPRELKLKLALQGICSEYSKTLTGM